MEAPAVPEVPKVPEPPKEPETDCAPLKAKNTQAVQFLTPDTTVNVLPSVSGNLLMGLQDYGFQHLMAGARANVGVKSGRYMFEVKICEFCSPSDQGGPYPRNLLRIGFSKAGSSLLLAENDAGVCFDSEGYFSCGQRGANKVAMSKLTAGSVVSCLLNLDSGSECANTISLFKDGRRLAPPQALPESLQGETLFPTLAFKCMTLQTNFGPEPMCDLPFKCHMVGAGSKTDLMFATAAVPKECEALFPVSLPDEGSFDWLDMFLEKNPSYIEISDRAVRDWAEKSANWTKRGLVVKSSNDKPEMCFNVRPLDDGFSVKKPLKAMAALQKRNYVVMEVKGNLIKEEREASMATFKENGYKVTAAVMVGTPPPEFKKKSLELLLKSKQEAIDTKHK